MSESVKAKIEKLRGIILANYTAAKQYDPQFATACAMEIVLRMVFGQPHHMEQLLDEEIEDNIKAGKRIAA